MRGGLYQFLARIRAFFFRSRLDEDLNGEITTHIDLLTEENIRLGMKPDVARREARLRFGSPDVARELHRHSRGLPLVEEVVKDVHHGARLLGRNPIFALTAALSLAIGIGADTTIFTIANALLLRAPAGIAQPFELVDIVARHGALNNISYLNFADMRSRMTGADLYA